MKTKNEKAKSEKTHAADSSEWTHWAQLLAWSGLIALGARRGGLLGLLAMGYGADRLSSLAFGTSLSRRLLAAATAVSREPRQRFGAGTRDAVDEASWESFPASDPPGRGIG